MKEDYQIEILISTMEGKVFKNEKLFFTHPRVQFTVINQTTEPEKFKDFPLPRNTKLLNFNERGLSRSRNRALKAASGDILVIADDDIFYSEDFAEKLIAKYKETKADAVLFQNVWNPRFHFDKVAGFFDLLKISSYEVSFLRTSLGSVQFDEDFGLGAKYNSGEENIFLVELKKTGAKTIISNYQLVNHPNLGTGYIWNIRTAEAKGALCRRLFGFAGFFAFLFFAVKKYRLYRKELSAAQFLRAGMRSFQEYPQRILPAQQKV